MIRIQIAQTGVREQTGTSQRTGKPYSMRIQTGYAFPVDAHGNPPPYPEKFDIILGREQPDAYPVGEYTLHPSAVYVDQRGNLSISPRLTPAPAKLAAATAAPGRAA